MSDINKVVIGGRVTRDLELRYTKSGNAVTNVGIASNRVWKDNEGEKHEDTCFVDAVLWGKQAETMAELLSKGKYVIVEGSLEMEEWQTNEGVKRIRYQVGNARVHLVPRERVEVGAPANSSSVPDDVPF